MQLRRLEIHGFKTFANPTTLEFPSGVTAIVGPNGSGKSNVSDAILWALGEQNVRTLRGGKLRDVIFAGCASRRPTGMAEVALTFDNSSRLLPLDYGEITVTRRVYRSEESEYFINRTACRLRDIVDLFLDTGIGRDSYFSLNQGEIDMVLSADPEERRTLFEEAAGVKKYRLRKRETLRKLESAEQNLSRIYDLISEVESRIEPLDRQAEAARKYQDLTKKLHESELGAFAAEWQSLTLRRDQLLLDLEDARVRAGGASRELERLEAEDQRAHQDLRRLSDTLETARQRCEEAAAERARAEGRISVLRERLNADAEGASRTIERLSEIAAQKEELSAIVETQRMDVAAVDQAIREMEAVLAFRRRELTAAENHWRSCTAEVERAQAREIQAASRMARLQASREESARRITSLEEQLKALNQRLNDLESRRQALHARRSQLEQVETAASEEYRARQQELDRLTEAVRGQQQEISDLAEEIRSLERDHAAQASRLRLLEELSEQREGFYKGVRAVLKAAANGQIKGHYHAVADLLTFDREYEAAMEAALGGSAQDIVTLTDQEAREGIYFLKRIGAGRATFLSLEIVSRLAKGGLPTAPDQRVPGIIGLASELARFDPLYRPVVEMLLGRVILCDNLENGNAAARRLSHWSRIVTLEGDVISSQGAMTGGSRPARPGGGTSIIGRTGQIQELKSTLIESERRLSDLRDRRTKMQQDADRLGEQRTAVERERQAA
ncbi:MAG TPA: chromosome segregation protein SMC, partial [Armatimonadota bacterium]|nr:chromosome segregation protein SMC [Armatimonadota bacterium]